MDLGGGSLPDQIYAFFCILVFLNVFPGEFYCFLNLGKSILFSFPLHCKFLPEYCTFLKNLVMHQSEFHFVYLCNSFIALTN